MAMKKKKTITSFSVNYVHKFHELNLNRQVCEIKRLMRVLLALCLVNRRVHKTRLMLFFFTSL